MRKLKSKFTGPGGGIEQSGACPVRELAVRAPLFEGGRHGIATRDFTRRISAFALPPLDVLTSGLSPPLNGSCQSHALS